MCVVCANKHIQRPLYTSQNVVSSMNFCPSHSYLTRFLSLSMFINHRVSLLCKFIFKAPNEPWQPSECLRPHKICGVSSTGTVGDTGPGAMEHGLALLCCGWSAGVSARALGSATHSICRSNPDSTVERAAECLFDTFADTVCQRTCGIDLHVGRGPTDIEPISLKSLKI